VSTNPTPAQHHVAPIASGGPSISQMQYLSLPRVAGDPPLPTSANSKEAATNEYYANTHAEATLAEFTNHYGFGTASEIKTIYYNYGDLGLGRNMHCSYFPTGAACYVSNYGRDPRNSDVTTNVAFGQDPDTSIDQAISEQGLIATVAMVYDTTNVANPVRFALYDSTNGLKPFAAVDNPGVNALNHPGDPTFANIAVPENCLTCHGGTARYVSGQSVQGATFLPFDPANLRFSSHNSTYSQANVLAQISALNKLVLTTNPAPAITAFVTNVYAPRFAGDPTAVPNPAYVPADWQSGGAKAVEVYNEVVKPYCRTCHLSQDESVGGLNWGSWTQFSSNTQIGPRACGGSTAPMPMAERTQTLFWQSPARAHLVNGLGIAGPCAP
jgi:hypothetical protein